MASMVLSSVGSYIGSAWGAWGSAIGGAIGSYAGSAIDRCIFGDCSKVNTRGPRLSDLSVQTSTEGASLPIVFGTMRLAGNVIWSTGLTEIATTEEQGGGSGGGGSSYTTYSYTTDCAVAICEGTITGIRRIWADTKLIYDVSETATAGTLVASSSSYAAGIRIYDGSETQLEDPLIQAVEGSAPAYRGTAYIVFEDLRLGDFGNRLPNFTFEVVKAGSPSTLTELNNYNNGTDTIIKCDSTADGIVRLFTLRYLGYNSSGGGYATAIDAWFVINGTRIRRGGTIIYTGTQYNIPTSKWTRSNDPLDDACVLIYGSAPSRVFLDFNGETWTAYRLKNVAGGSSDGRAWVDSSRIVFADLSYGICIYNRQNLVPGPYNYFGYFGPGIYVASGTENYPVTRLSVPIGSQYTVGCVINNDYLYAGTWNTNSNFIHRVALSEISALSGDHAYSDVTWSTYTYVRVASGLHLSRGTVDITFGGDVIHYDAGEKVYRSTTWPIFAQIGTIPNLAYINMNDDYYTGRQLSTKLWFFAGYRGYVNMSFGLLVKTTQNLQTICEQVVAESLLEASQYDFSALSDVEVRGYTISKVMSIKTSLDSLMSAYNFELFEEDNKIIARKLLSSTIDKVLIQDNLGAESYV